MSALKALIEHEKRHVRQEQYELKRGNINIGTQVLIYGFVANYYATAARAAGVAWCAGFGAAAF